MARKKIIMSDHKRHMCELDAATIRFYRNNPCMAAKDLLGINLLDSQKYVLQAAWNSSNIAWVCCRNFGKSFLIAVFCLLKAILYENQNIYIISSVGTQAKETFTKIEEIVLRKGRTSESIASLKDIAAKECCVNPSNKDGFKHNPESYSVEFYNGSKIFTLNSKPDNLRSRRATLICFDEAAFCSDEILSIASAFGAQDMDFKTSVDTEYDPRQRPKQVPTQILMASSQDGMDTQFYKNYKSWAKEMLAGKRNFFVCDMSCDTAINVYMNGKPYQTLLSQETVDTALKSNKEKALREYYNKPTKDGGSNQIIKWATVRKNERSIIPYADWKPENRIVLAFDPARTNDNSVLGAMNIYNDPEYGLCGDIINFVNFIDTASSKGYKLDSNRQLQMIRDYLLRYNGEALDYEFIDSFMLDAGSGGGGVSTYADGLLKDWVDDKGKTHAGLIDKSSDIYAGYSKQYKNAIDKLHLIQPRKYRTQMVEEFIELMNLGVIRMPFEYTGSDFVRILRLNNQPSNKSENDEEESFDNYILSNEEKISFSQIDLMKSEITSIYKTMNPERTSATYALSKEKENIMHDDRAYVMFLLAHRLYELRRDVNFNNRKSKHSNVKNFIQIRTPKVI